MSEASATNGFSPESHDGDAGVGELQLGNIRLDLAVFAASVGQRSVPLAYQEFELLRYMAGFKDRVISFDALCKLLWGTAGRKQTRRLNVLVHRLRSHLHDSFPYQLVTVRGRGYGLLSTRGGSGPKEQFEGGKR